MHSLIGALCVLQVLLFGLLHRDVSGSHALDYALRNRQASALKLLLRAALRLPPRARAPLIEQHRAGTSPPPAFLTELARHFPEVAADWLLQLGLDAYEPFEGAPSNCVKRAKLHHLMEPPLETASSRWMAFKQHATPHPQGVELWNADERNVAWPVAPATRAATGRSFWAAVGGCFGCKWGTAAKESLSVDVECRLVGIPGLHGTASEDRQLFEAFTTQQTVENPAMVAAIMYKWDSWGRRAWLGRVVRFLVLACSYLTALIIMPSGSDPVKLFGAEDFTFEVEIDDVAMGKVALGNGVFATALFGLCLVICLGEVVLERDLSNPFILLVVMFMFSGNAAGFAGHPEIADDIFSPLFFGGRGFAQARGSCTAHGPQPQP